MSFIKNPTDTRRPPTLSNTREPLLAAGPNWRMLEDNLNAGAQVELPVDEPLLAAGPNWRMLEDDLNAGAHVELPVDEPLLAAGPNWRMLERDV
jgi:hypothetical protein